MLGDARTTLFVTGGGTIEDNSLSPDVDGLGRGGEDGVEMGVRVDDGRDVTMTIWGGFVRGGDMFRFGRCV